jgi:hypothetical protein
VGLPAGKSTILNNPLLDKFLLRPRLFTVSSSMRSLWALSPPASTRELPGNPYNFCSLSAVGAACRLWLRLRQSLNTNLRGPLSLATKRLAASSSMSPSLPGCDNVKQILPNDWTDTTWPCRHRIGCPKMGHPNITMNPNTSQQILWSIWFIISQKLQVLGSPPNLRKATSCTWPELWFSKRRDNSSSVYARPAQVRTLQRSGLTDWMDFEPMKCHRDTIAGDEHP